MARSRRHQPDPAHRRPRERQLVPQLKPSTAKIQPCAECAVRLDPMMTIDGAFFWKAAAEGRLAAKKCGGCGRLWHPPRPICPECHAVVDQEQTLSGRATVISWAMPIHPPAIGFEAPPIVVLVETEEGLRMVSNVEGVLPQDMRIGLKVEVGFAPTTGGKMVPIFHPAGTA